MSDTKLVEELRSAARKVAALKAIAGLRGASATTLSRLQVTSEKAADRLAQLERELAEAVKLARDRGTLATVDVASTIANFRRRAETAEAERDEARRQWKNYEAAASDLLAERDSLAAKLKSAEEAASNIIPYLRFTIGDESPGYHPTMPSAVGAFEYAMFPEGYEKHRVERLRALASLQQPGGRTRATLPRSMFMQAWRRLVSSPVSRGQLLFGSIQNGQCFSILKTRYRGWVLRYSSRWFGRSR